MFFVFPLLLLLACCHKPPEPEPNPEPDLPTATQEGKGTIGCYVNGKPWVPKPYLCLMCDGFFKAVVRHGELNIHFNNYKFENTITINQRIEINIASPKLGENEILTELIFIDWQDRMDDKYYYLDTTKPHVLFLTKLDSVNRIIAGNFEFTAIDKKRKSTVVVTKGRFDAGSYDVSFW